MLQSMALTPGFDQQIKNLMQKYPGAKSLLRGKELTYQAGYRTHCYFSGETAWT